MSYPLPHISVPVIDMATGRMTEPWFFYFAEKEGLSQLSQMADIPAARHDGALTELAGVSAVANQTVSRRMNDSALSDNIIVRLPQRRGGQGDITDLLGYLPLPKRRQWSTFDFLQDTAANLALYPAAAYPLAMFIETDTFTIWRSDGSAWSQVGAWDDAYSSAWDGSKKWPTQNAVYDEFVAVLALVTTNTSQYAPLFDHFADIGNVGTGEDDLYSDTLTAGKFAANGDKVFGHYAGIFVGAVTASQRLRLYVGGTLCFDTGALSIGAATTDNWSLHLFIIRVSASVLRVAVSAHSDFATLGAPPKYTEVTGLTLANTQIVKITGEASGAGAADNQIVAKLSTLAYSKAA